jgi:hypothetical protein
LPVSNWVKVISLSGSKWTPPDSRFVTAGSAPFGEAQQLYSMDAGRGETRAGGVRIEPEASLLENGR